jgi:outer membrane protein
MSGRGFGRATLAAAAAWVCSAACYPALVQAQAPGGAPGAGAAAAPQSAPEAPVNFDIPVQPMAAALNSWALQANAQIFVDPALVAQLTAPAIQGALAPQEALRTLLAHTNLQVTQGANGVYVIKPRPVIAQIPKRRTPRPAAALVAPDAIAAAPRPPATALESEGPWLLRLDADYAKGNGSASGGATAAIGGEYFLTDHVAAAVSVTLPRTQSFEVPQIPGATGYRASARLQSSMLGLKYYFAPESPVRPYLGAGIEIATLYDASGVSGLEHATVGPAVQAGVDLRLNPHWMLNADVSWAQVRPDLAFPNQEIRVDPVRFGLGFVYRFGAVGPE